MKKIFITHSSFEEEFAEKLREILENTFCCEVFIFKEKMKFGDEWFGVIRGNLKEANLQIIILSPISVERPWTYFEAGGSWLKKRTKPIPMRLCLSKNEIPESNPLSRLWQGDFFMEKDIRKLFVEIKDKIPLKDDEEGEGMEKVKEKFVKEITSTLGDKYKILEGFRKIMDKDVRKAPNVFSLHKQGIAPVPAILQEAFGENYLEEKLGVSLNKNNEENEKKIYISSYSPAKLGEMIRCFENLGRQGFIKRVDTPLKRFLKKTIKKAEERVNFPSEIVETLIKNEAVLKEIHFNEKPLVEFIMRPMMDEDDLVVFLQIEKVIEEILGKDNDATSGPSPVRIWCSVIKSTIEWFEEYKEYYYMKLTLSTGKGEKEAGILGRFYTFLWKMGYEKKELRDFLRSWYKILV